MPLFASLSVSTFSPPLPFFSFSAPPPQYVLSVSDRTTLDAFAKARGAAFVAQAEAAGGEDGDEDGDEEGEEGEEGGGGGDAEENPLRLVDCENNGAARMLCMLLSASHNDVFLRPLLGLLHPDEVHVALIFLRQVLRLRLRRSGRALHPSSKAARWLCGAPVPSVNQTVTWIAMMVDSHFASLILHAGDTRDGAAAEADAGKDVKDVGAVVGSLFELVKSACDELDAVESLKGYMSLLRYDRKLLQSAGTAGYSVEVLHL